MTTTRTFTLHKLAFTLLAIGAFCVGLSATADAAPYRRGKKVQKHQGDRMTRMMRRFDKLDVNDDGRIGWFELHAAPARFQKRLAAANTDGNWFVTRAEFRASCVKHAGKHKGFRKGKGKRRGKGAVIRDHRTGTVTPLRPNRAIERIPARRGLHTM